ncbi:hypothetical protein ACIGEZ_21785 [Streptomyces sp. NPDC085481]|uniref:hypothetical protein n=1 Tax=Streptomyces sp. NPDC085481 TaxID=3365727 RepID=UPI0037D25034
MPDGDADGVENPPSDHVLPARLDDADPDELRADFDGSARELDGHVARENAQVVPLPREGA